VGAINNQHGKTAMADRVRIRACMAALGAVVLFIGWSGGACGQGVPPLPVKKFDLYLSGHVIGLFPQDKDLSVGGNRILNTDVRGTVGAGIKFDIYPWFTKNIVGAEIEVFGLGGSVRAPRTTSGSGTTQAQGSLIAITTMYNLMLRYPGETIQPYIGAGVGSSTGILYDVNIQSGNVGLSGTSGNLAFAYQFLGGVRAFVTKKLFLFGEYKYFVTNYSWGSEGAGTQQVKLDFQTNIVSGGIGWSF
jgi:opacity protein-like surface antigen